MEVVHTIQAFGKVKGIVGHAAVVLDWSESRWFGRLKKNVQKGGYVETLLWGRGREGFFEFSK